MSSLARTDQEILVGEIVDDALGVTPVDYQEQLIEAFRYLAYCHSQDGMQAHLEDIQALISAAHQRNDAAIQKMTCELRCEISQLREETRSGFESVCSYIAETREALENRLSRLERQPTSPPVKVVVQNSVYWDGDWFFHIAGVCITTVVVWSLIKIAVGGQN
jgi:hypothetical protein